MKGKLIWSIFWAMVGVFVIAVATMFIPPVGRSPMRFSGFSAWVVLSGLGVTLLVLTVFVLLHNLVSALLNTEEPVFFIIATIVCPIGFLVGAVGTIVLAIKSKPSKYSGQNI